MKQLRDNIRYLPWKERRSHRFVRQNRMPNLGSVQSPLMFDEIAELCPAGIVIITVAGKIRYTNPLAQKMLGMTREQYSARDYNAPNWRTTDYAGRLQGDDELVFSRVLASGKAVLDAEHAVERADGTRIYLRISGQPMFGTDGKISQVIFTMMDVSDAVLAERARAAGETKYRELVESLNEGVCMLGADFETAQFVNPRMAQMLGYTADEIVGRSLFEFVPVQTHAEVRQRMQRRREGQRESYEMQMLCKDGRLIDVSIASTPLRAEGGGYIGAVGAITDITSRNRIELALRSSEKRFASALEFAPIGMAIVGLDGRWITVNQAICRIVGYSTEELMSLGFQDITHQDDLELDLSNLERLLQGEVSSYQMIKRYVRKDRQIVWIQLSVSLVRDDAGQPVHFISQIVDLTEQRAQEAQLRASEERFRLMVNSVLDYEIVMLDPEGIVVSWNAGAERIKGYQAQEIIGRHFSCFYPPEVAATEKPKQELISAAREGRLEDEGWRLRKDGTRYWANVILTAIRGDDGALRGYVKLTRDQSQRKRAETELRESRQRVEANMLLMQRQHRDMTLFAEFSGILQSCIATEEIQAPIRRYGRLLFPECAGVLYLMQPSRNHLEIAVQWGEVAVAPPLFEPQACWALRRGQPHVHASTDDLCCAHSPHTDARISLCLPMVAQNDALGLLYLELSADDLAALERIRSLGQMAAERIGMTIANLRLRESLRQQSIRDTLTQLYNRRYLEETVQRELAAAQRAGSGVAVLMVDVDHFKKFNDRHGHEAGDQALRSLARQLEKSCRSSDIACRYGGEEFTLVLTRVNTEQALARAQELCDNVRTQELFLHGQLLGRITISVGVALFPQHGSDLQVLKEVADRALYLAKNSGRDRVVLSDETS